MTILKRNVCMQFKRTKILRNSNIKNITYKKYNYNEPINHVIVTWWKIHHNGKQKRNVIVTLFPYLLQMYHKNC